MKVPPRIADLHATAAMAAFQSPSPYNFCFANSAPCQSGGKAFKPPRTTPSFQASDDRRGMRRRAFDHQTKLFSPKQPAQQFLCEICNVQLNSVSQAEQHKYGKVHQNKVKMLEESASNSQGATPDVSTSLPQPDLPTQNPVHDATDAIIPHIPKERNQGISMICAVCQKTFNSEIQAKQHFKSQLHGRKIQEAIEGKITPIMVPVTTLPTPKRKATPAEVTTLPTLEGKVTPAQVTTLPTLEGKVTPAQVTTLPTLEGKVTPAKVTTLPTVEGTVAPAQVTNTPTPEESAAEVATPASTETTLVQQEGNKHVPSGSAGSEIPPPAMDIQSNTFYCETCNVTSNSKSQYDMHIQGARHKNAVSTTNLIHPGVNGMFGVPQGNAAMVDWDDTAGPPAKRSSSPVRFMFYCEDCAANLNSQKQLVQHMTSPKHMKQAHRRRQSPMMPGQQKERFQGRGRGVSRFKSSTSDSGPPGAKSTPPPLFTSFVKGGNSLTSSGVFSPSSTVPLTVGRGQHGTTGRALVQ